MTTNQNFPIRSGKTTLDDVDTKTKILPWLYWNKILKGTA
jgi:hypothetical protein